MIFHEFLMEFDGFDRWSLKGDFSDLDCQFHGWLMVMGFID